jgi:hypothetical protein
MKKIYIVYRESDSRNLAAFTTYEAASDWITNYLETADYYIDEVPFYE